MWGRSRSTREPRLHCIICIHPRDVLADSLYKPDRAGSLSSYAHVVGRLSSSLCVSDFRRPSAVRESVLLRTRGLPCSTKAVAPRRGPACQSPPTPALALHHFTVSRPLQPPRECPAFLLPKQQTPPSRRVGDKHPPQAATQRPASPMWSPTAPALPYLLSWTLRPVAHLRLSASISSFRPRTAVLRGRTTFARHPAVSPP